LAIDKPRGSKYWRIRITTPNGIRLQRSTRTTDKKSAQELHDKIKAELWRRDKLQEKPERKWKEAVIRWIKESSHKPSVNDDKDILKWLDPYLGKLNLSQINHECIEDIVEKKAATGVKSTTVNRMLEVIRKILRKAKHKWNWIDNIPHIEMKPEDKGRIRWLTQNEAQLLLSTLPSHLSDMAAFSLATGLRKFNVTHLKWENIDLVKRHALVHHDEAKTKKAIPVPLNSDAIIIIKRQIAKHDSFVFTYKGNPVNETNTKAWRKALKKYGIENFRWHDLRHTWASWHVQNGTSLHELQQLGGWSSYEMVLRYAHLSSHQLRDAAERISGSKLVQAN
jgi:integrase